MKSNFLIKFSTSFSFSFHPLNMLIQLKDPQSVVFLMILMNFNEINQFFIAESHCIKYNAFFFYVFFNKHLKYLNQANLSFIFKKEFSTVFHSIYKQSQTERKNRIVPKKQTKITFILSTIAEIYVK